MLAVYFQNNGQLEAYGEDDSTWLEGYATAVGRIFGFHFRKEPSTPTARAASGL